MTSDDSSKKNVLHLVEYLYLGGIERLLEQIAIKTEERARLHFFTYETEILSGIGRSLQDKGYPVFTYKKKSGTDLGLLKKLIQVIKEQQIDVVHTHDFGPMEYAFLLKLRFPNLKLVHTQHTMHHFIVHKKYTLFFQVASYFYSRIIAVSQFVEDSIKTYCPLTNRLSLCVIPNGVDSELFKPASDLEVSLDSRHLKLVSVARISPQKNMEYILNTCLLLKREGIPFVLHHAGASKKPEETDQVEQFIQSNDLRKEIILHGFVDNTLAVLNQGDIFVSASKKEGHPVALLEAMSCEKLCICSDIPPHREIAKDDLILFDLNDEQALFKILKNHFLERLKIRERQKMARINVLNNFSLEKVVQNYVNQY